LAIESKTVMLEPKGDGETKHEVKGKRLVSLNYEYKFEKEFGKPCIKWLGLIVSMSNEVLGNFIIKEDRALSAAFGSREKQRLNMVFEAIKFSYLDYPNLAQGAKIGVKRKLQHKATK
jgi:hypothetical protein